MMPIGKRLRQLREHKGLSQRDVEKASGLSPYYISRVENGHTIPSFETLGKFAEGLNLPLFRLCYTEKDTPAPNLTLRKPLKEVAAHPGNSASDDWFLL